MSAKPYTFRIDEQTKEDLRVKVFECRKNASLMAREAIKAYLNGAITVQPVFPKDKTATFTLDESDIEAMKVKAESDGVTFSEAFTQVLKQYVKAA